MTQIEILNKLGMIDQSDPNYQEPPKEQASWINTLEALRLNPNPKAQKLYERMVKKYGVDKLKQDVIKTPPNPS